MKKNVLHIITLILTLLSNLSLISQTRSVAVNIPLAVTGSCNIEPSILLGRKHTFNTVISWNPFTWNNNRKFKHLNVMAGIRWWQWHSYSGFFTGVYGSGCIYNIGYRKYRYEGLLSGVSITAGYAKMISRKFNLEFEGGFIAGYNSYDKFEKEVCGEYLLTVNKFSLLPSKISISLVYIF